MSAAYCNFVFGRTFILLFVFLHQDDALCLAEDGMLQTFRQDVVSNFLRGPRPLSEKWPSANEAFRGRRSDFEGRPEVACPQTFTWETCTSRPSTSWTAEDSKSCQTGWPCSEVPNSPSTPPWSLHCTAMALRGGCKCRRRGSGSGKTPQGEALPWVVCKGADCWCWLLKWRDGGARRPPSSSPPWPKHALSVLRRWSSSLAARLVHFPCPCWTSARFQICEIPSAHEVLRDDRFTWVRVFLSRRFRRVSSCIDDCCFRMPVFSFKN